MLRQAGRYVVQGVDGEAYLSGEHMFFGRFVFFEGYIIRGRVSGYIERCTQEPVDF